MKAVITDLDRTLLHTDKSVSNDTVKVLKSCREKGILLVAATARPERAITQWQPTVYEKLSEAPLPDVCYKIIVSSNELDLHEYMDQILTDDTYASVADGVLFQIMSKQATKWNGIRATLDSLGISPEEAVFFGDDNDDIESLKNCGIGAAVSNAIESAKEAADIIIKSNDEDGVAEFLKEKVLGRRAR